MAGSVTPVMAMVIVQLGYAGMNITSKLAIQSGMHPLVLVTYRQIFATIALAPFAYCLERNTVPRMTKRIAFQILLSSLTGVSGNQILYFVGLKYSTPTIACALNNMLPAFTFVLAVLFRQEYLRIKTLGGVAKALGTVLSVGGAILLSFYHGKVLGFGESRIHWRYADKMEREASSRSESNLLLGPVAVIGSALVWAVWFIVQANMSKSYPAPYTSTFYMCFIASIQCMAIALSVEHRASAWSLHSTIRLTSSLYAGTICSALAYVLLSWTIQRKGPLYVSVFSPLLLVIIAVLSWALLHEELYVGTAIGSVLIVFGLYFVLWGKNKEMNKTNAVQESVTEVIKDSEKGLELQPYDPFNRNGNGIHHGAN
ncbi:WAT1-related protein At1g09380 [Cajanus cajan]|uniref:WAT1-related protein n=1 Tax=Cajanus cajan TaxID=3821 RepID=A0A151U4K5_CAJCA|nr:WAT1-related protein At1g09380 [Cajanus cajan]KYP74259.1 Auxin-induced protein 5NG4 [Cajanus cajan]